MSEIDAANALTPALSQRETEPIKPRIDFIDYAKGIGILLVVVAHVWRGLNNNGIVTPEAIRENGVLDRWVYGFHMPLFFFVSGLFLYRSAAKPAAMFLVDKLSTIAWPFFVWTIVYWLLARVGKGGAGGGRSVGALARAFYDPGSSHTHLWFLYVLFVIALAMLVFRKLNVPASGVLLFAIVLNVAVRGNWLPVAFGPLFQFAMFLPYVAGAAVLAPLLIRSAERWSVWPWLLIAIAGLAITTYAALYDQRPDPMFSPYSGWAGIAMTLAIARLIELAGAWPLRWLGTLSLEIYLAHIAVIAIVRLVLMKFHVSTWLPHLVIDSLAGLVGPIVLALACAMIGFPYLFRFRASVANKRADVSGKP